MPRKRLRLPDFAFFVGYRTIIARYVAKWGIAQMCLRKIKSQGGGGIAPFWGSANLPEKKYRAIWGIAAIVSQYRAIWDLTRGPAAILFILRDTCSDSIAKLFRAWFCGVSHNYRAIRCIMGYRTDVPV